jgi:4-hydroxy-3-polyprenylbenzoate decarboxylase
LKTVLPNADFVIEGYVDPSSLRYDATSPLEKPKRDEGPFGDHARCAGNPKRETRNPNGRSEVSSSEFGLRPSFGFRPSVFGFLCRVTAITHRKDAVYPATIVGISPTEDFYLVGASVKLFLPIFKMNSPEIVDPATAGRCRPKASSTTSSS